MIDYLLLMIDYLWLQPLYGGVGGEYRIMNFEYRSFWKLAGILRRFRRRRIFDIEIRLQRDHAESEC